MLVSPLCAGTMGYGSFVADESECHAQLTRFFELGVNFFDTAELYPSGFRRSGRQLSDAADPDYGRTTEQWVGTWLSGKLRRGEIRQRGDVCIATKVNPAGIGASAERGCAGKLHAYEEDVILTSCRASIERLQCAYIDLYQLHWPVRDTPFFGGVSFLRPGSNMPRSVNIGDASISALDGSGGNMYAVTKGNSPHGK